MKHKFRAQSLMEILVAVAVGSILIGGSATLMALSLQNYKMVRQKLVANSLIHQEAEIIQALGRGNWHTIYDLNKDTNYYTTASSSTWVISSGQEIDAVDEIPYKRYFQISNVNRDGSGDITDIGDINDPSTQKITVFLEYGDNYARSSSLLFYLIRSEDNYTFTQTDWSGGSGQAGPVPNPSSKYDSASNIDDSTALQITMATTTSDGILTSSILDTGVINGAGFNSLLWQGSSNDGNVKFQIAFATSSTSTWEYSGDYQPIEGFSISFPTAGTDSPQNNRYIRYKVFLSVPYSTSTSPTVNGIIINWNP